MISYLHIEKCGAYTNAHCLQAKNVFTKLCACIYAYMNMHISYTLTYTHMDTDAQAHTQLYIHQNTFMPTHTSMC